MEEAFRFSSNTSDALKRAVVIESTKKRVSNTTHPTPDSVLFTVGKIRKLAAMLDTSQYPPLPQNLRLPHLVCLYNNCDLAIYHTKNSSSLRHRKQSKNSIKLFQRDWSLWRIISSGRKEKIISGPGSCNLSITIISIAQLTLETQEYMMMLSFNGRGKQRIFVLNVSDFLGQRSS